MTAIRRMLAAFSLVCTLTACSPSPDEQREPPPPVEGTAFGDTVATMDKARAVEDATMQHKEDVDRALQEAEGH